MSSEVFRGAALNRRLPACLRLLRVPTTDAAQQLLMRRPDLMPAMLTTVLIGVTQFFRESAVFENVRRLALPELRAGDVALRCASFGVSRGHELYSMAMLLAEEGLLARSELFGLDCRADAIVSAAAGRFEDDDVAGLSPERVERFFFASENGYVVRPELRARVHWAVGDLFAWTRTTRFHVVFFRNVAIYLAPAAAARAWEMICDQLAPGGYVVTGKAERPPTHLRLRRVAASLYRREPN